MNSRLSSFPSAMLVQYCGYTMKENQGTDLPVKRLACFLIFFRQINVLSYIVAWPRSFVVESEEGRASNFTRETELSSLLLLDVEPRFKFPLFSYQYGEQYFPLPKRAMGSFQHASAVC